MRLAELCPVPLPEDPSLPEEIFLGPGAGDTLTEVVKRYLGAKILLVADPDTRKAGETALETLRNQAFQIHELLLPKQPHADDAAIESILSEATGITGMLAVGSGTINDLVKSAATRCGVEYVVLGTAASMNGYASGIAAITSKGVKITLPARPPRAIVLDEAILMAAPLEMSQAGLGDLLSKPVSMADWWLGHRLEGSSYSDLPGKIVGEAVRTATANASGIPSRDPVAYQALARAVVLSGVSMVVAGSSSPASGGEHLMSHLWDMEAHLAGKPLRLHGAQVGVATLISAALYQRLLAESHPPIPIPPTWEEEQDRIQKVHGSLAEAVLDQARQKHSKRQDRLEILKADWAGIREDLRALGIPTSDQLRKPLVAAGAPRTLKDLGLSIEDALRALRIARDIRSRYTVLDLAYELGVFPDAIKEVLCGAGV
jgi:glycerol-1-phosphate dehydrogenase [NAD(P)+]